MARVAAVTGATGFIGTHVVRQLADRGWAVRILARRVPGDHGFPLPPVEAVIGDLVDGESLRRLVTGADAVIHLAGLVKAPSANAFVRANVEGTRRLVEAISTHSKARLVHVSSLAAREPGLSDYARSKAASEDEIRKISGYNNWIILRPSVVYGPGDRETLGFFQSAKHGIAVVPGPRDQRISFIYVNCLSDIINVLVEIDMRAGQTLEIDDGKAGGYGWPEIVSALSRAAAKRLRTVYLPAPCVQIAAHVNAALHQLSGGVTMFTPGKARELLHRDWVARPPAIALPGWRPVDGLVEGFEKAMRWYRLAGWL